jgi:hypothetical protein
VSCARARHAVVCCPAHARCRASGTTVCDTDNGGCDSNADCVFTAGTRVCNCRLGFAGNGTVGNCFATPMPVKVVLMLKTTNPVNQVARRPVAARTCAAHQTHAQNTFTSNLANALKNSNYKQTGSTAKWSEARINFDNWFLDNVTNITMVTFYLLPDPVTGESGSCALARYQR